jgi:glycyl-tRNA synthetase beta chain
MSGTSDFLVELGTEELPPLALKSLMHSFADGIRAGLKDAGLAHAEVEHFATPRRLAVLVHGLAEVQQTQSVKLKGPPVNAAFDPAGKPTMAATRFAEKCGVPVDALARVTEGKGEFLYFEGTKPGLTTVGLLPAIVQK